MSWFVRLDLVKGGVIYVRPEMVKAVYDIKPDNSNVVVDGHDFEVVGDSHAIMAKVEFHIEPECA
jgi:hypothetical protein